jgi:hypothetical protein
LVSGLFLKIDLVFRKPKIMHTDTSEDMYDHLDKIKRVKEGRELSEWVPWPRDS